MDDFVQQPKKTSNNSEREEFLKIIGGRVRNLRLQKKWTQEKLAQEAQINDKYVYDIEMGNKCMSIWVLEKITKALEIDATKLLKG